MQEQYTIKPVMVIFELHQVPETIQAVGDNAQNFFNDGYRIILDEGAKDTLSAQQECERRKAQAANLKKQPISLAIQQTLKDYEYRTALYERLGKYSFQVQTLDPVRLRLQKALEEGKTSLREIHTWRDEGMAQTLEKARLEYKDLGIIAILGVQHSSVQHYLLKINPNAANHYRFFYFYHGAQFSLKNMYESKYGYTRDDIFPLGVTAVNCENRNPQSIYQAIIKPILAISNQQPHTSKESLREMLYLLEKDKQSENLKDNLGDYPLFSLSTNYLKAMHDYMVDMKHCPPPPPQTTTPRILLPAPYKQRDMNKYCLWGTTAVISLASAIAIAMLSKTYQP